MLSVTVSELKITTSVNIYCCGHHLINIKNARQIVTLISVEDMTMPQFVALGLAQRW